MQGVARLVFLGRRETSLAGLGYGSGVHVPAGEALPLGARAVDVVRRTALAAAYCGGVDSASGFGLPRLVISCHCNHFLRVCLLWIRMGSIRGSASERSRACQALLNDILDLFRRNRQSKCERAEPLLSWVSSLTAKKLGKNGRDSPR